LLFGKQLVALSAKVPVLLLFGKQLVALSAKVPVLLLFGKQLVALSAKVPVLLCHQTVVSNPCRLGCRPCPLCSVVSTPNKPVSIHLT